MKRKIFTVLLVIAVMAAAFTGCASEDSNEVANMIESLEARHESGPGVYVPESEEPKASLDLREHMESDGEAARTGAEDGTGQAVESDIETEDGQAVRSDGETEDGQAINADSTKAGNAGAENSGTVDADGKDWSTAYEDYFDRENTLPEMPKVRMLAYADGMTMTIECSVAEDVGLLRFECGDAVMDMYTTREKVYAYTWIEGEEEWVYTQIASEEEAASMMSYGEMAQVSSDWKGIKRYTYRSAVVQNAITYDTLNVVMEDKGETYACVFYINRETQMVERYSCVKDGTNMDCYIEEGEAFSLPEETAKAKKVEMEDISTKLITVMLMGVQGN